MVGAFYLYVGKENGPYTPNSNHIQRLMLEESVPDHPSTYKRLANRILSHRDDVQNIFNVLKSAGKDVYGYGASTKGNIILNYCGLGPNDILAIGDRNPEKDGLVTPGTRIPIISHEKLRSLKPEYSFVFIWHFRNEDTR